MEARGARRAPGSFFRSGSHCPALLRSPVLSRLGNSPARSPPCATRVSPIYQNPFFPLRPYQFDLSVHPSPLRWGNSPPDDSLSDGQPHLLRFQTPAPATRRSPSPDPDGRDPVTRVAPHGREGQRKKERVCIPPSAHMRTRICARARLYEKENHSKTTCCRPP